ncbi:MAG: CoA-transferase [Deltaproteobacteria bacterium]|nr:CoA-transferase [Deltaproteobacteria bacterium]
MFRNYKLHELMVVRCAKEIRDGEVVFAGVGLPLITVSFAMATHAPNMILLTEGGSIRATAPPGLAITVDDPALFCNGDAASGMLSTMAALQRGEVDVAFIGGAQIDRYGNVNSTGVGNWDEADTFTYFAGSGGANDMAASAKRVLAMMPQDPKKFVERVDYVTTPGPGKVNGFQTGKGWIPGGPTMVVSTMGVYKFDDNTREIYLAEYFPGLPVERIRANCSFDLKISPDLKQTPIPSEEELTTLRSIDPTGFYLD